MNKLTQRINANLINLLISVFYLASCASNNLAVSRSIASNTIKSNPTNVPLNYVQQQGVLRVFPLDNYPSSADYWLSETTQKYGTGSLLFTKDLQAQRFQEFKQYYYGSHSPWDQKFIQDSLIKPHQLYSQELDKINEFNNSLIKNTDSVGYGSNFRIHDFSWTMQIMSNMGIAQFKQLSYSETNKAITVDNLLIKTIPTDDPWFLSYKLAGQGYPFDQNQESALYISTPVYILGQSLDQQWVLVATPWQDIGWVHSAGVARANSPFTQKWNNLIKSNGLVAVTSTKTSLITQHDIAIGYSYIGTVFPIADKDWVAVPQKNFTGEAQLRYVKLSKQHMRLMPLAPTIDSFKMVIKNLQNLPYGWGGYNFYNDCSAELLALFTTFGYYLPRNSSAQAHVKTGEIINLSAYSVSNRLKYIMINGKPFRTLIHIPGHIMLYVGNKTINGVEYPIVYNDMWGLKPVDKSYTDVIGESLFFPLMQQYPEDKNVLSLLNRNEVEVIFLN